ncbi:MAG: cytochrome c oxidase subunit [Actinomycetota bacterium]|jgi:nitrosocyanin|nr:cytochrome c oxidase subunit [Actinomycetota bacterium]
MRSPAPAARSSLLSALLAAVVAVGLSGCGGTQTEHRTVNAARVDGGAGFVPLTITVDKRNRVVMKVSNTTDTVHGFSIEGYGIQKEVKPGEPIDVKFTATNAGTYKVYCQLHETHKTATLIVR